MLLPWKTTDKQEATLVVNGRYRVHRITGVQRYAHEIVSRLGGEVDLCAPQSAKGIAGHLWEQSVLPLACKGRLLWSPCGSGPLGYGRQVVTFHDLFPVEHPEWYGVAYSRWYGVAMRRLAARAIHLIAVSEYTKSRLVTTFWCRSTTDHSNPQRMLRARSLQLQADSVRRSVRSICRLAAMF
jgi:hypothetical protein